MASILLSNKSGGDNILSGTQLWSGKFAGPVGGVQLRADRMNSGNVYVGYSGGVTVTSGGFPLSGGGLMDGMQLGPGDAYFAPKALLSYSPSGTPQLFAACDAGASGFARVYYEPV